VAEALPDCVFTQSVPPVFIRGKNFQRIRKDRRFSAPRLRSPPIPDYLIVLLKLAFPLSLFYKRRYGYPGIAGAVAN
jgi:hypothetical protein